MFACVCALAHAQASDTIRYVHPNGSYSNDGKSWATARNRVQDAINDLHAYLEEYGLTSGSVYIAAGTYTPTESTESSGGSMLNTSFKIYAGIHVYGGFNPDTPEETPGDRIMANGKKVKDNWSDPSGIGTTSGTEISSQWDLKYKTILTGNHSGSDVTFTYDPIRGRYNAAFPANSYHVVWFATNGKYEDDDTEDNTTADELKDHFKPLAHPASLDGCVICEGNASNRNTIVREHTGFGGGVYMVGNSSMRACTVVRCNATMRGGGIYCDGGGNIEFCYVHTCQSVGVGVYAGYGGGVCIDYDGSIGHSHIQNCAARCGGGLMISHVPEEYPVTGISEIDNISNYSPFSTACVITNNTANAEGGGVYLAEGGTVNHGTVCANMCIGPDVTYYGRRHGRTGGIYVRNCGMIFNSVFWGNRCDVNNDIQFASVRQKAGVEGYETFAYHTAFMNHDITDWTGVRKEAVYSLDKENMPTEGSSSNHPCFFDPSADPNRWDYVNVGEHFYGAGVITSLEPDSLPGPRIWHLTSYSALDQKGVQWNETVQDVSPWLIHAHTDYGVVSNPYEPVSTLGGLVRKPDPIVYALVPPQGLEGRKALTENPDLVIPTIFIDPNRKGVFDEGVFVPQEQEGNSWDTPIRDLGEGVEYFRKRFVDTIPSNRYYRLPKLDGDGKPTGEDTIFHTVQILVKEGTVTTVGPGNYVNRNLRSAAIVTYGHMRYYGGYPSSLTGIDTDGRNPRNYRSTIRCRVTGEEGAIGYANNSAHAFALVNADSVVVDGFMLQDANTHAVVAAQAANDGGGIVVNNSTIAPKYRVNMVYNQVRNCVISNCCSPKGAGIFVNAEWPKANGDTCYAELKIINTVIRNCKAADALATETSNNGGIVTANGRSFIHLDHCNIMNNVGIPFKTDNRRTDNTAMGYHGYIRVDNSIIYCNADRKYDMYTDIPANSALSVNDAGDSFIYGTYNMFDADLYVPVGHVTLNHPEGFFKSDYTVPTIIAGFVPTGVDSELSDDEGTTPSRTNKKILTRINTDANYPSFVNPSRIIGNSPTGDKALYGGTVSYTPMTTNPCVNAAGNSDKYTSNDNFDRSDVIARNCGGEPDIGAIENTDLPAAGAVIYVTPNGAGKRDGSSWANAIAGNTVYVLNDIIGPALATGDQIDPEHTCDRVLDSEGNPILTTNEKYNGGWGRVWMNTHTIYSTTHDATTHYYITEKSIYYGKEGDGDGREVIDDERESIEVLPDGEDVPSVPEGFVAGYYYDPRYPYGEISGASRSFWRANPYHNGTDWNNASAYANVNAFAAACNANGWINNTRAERYVGGLQYAVEKASAANKTYHSDSVQVWVGAGKYTDYKGFVMRDSVTVYGGFPATKYNAPGMAERQALMDTVLNIPKSKPAEKLDAEDYETILQISDENPNKAGDNTTLNGDAVKYWDDDINFVENRTITGEVEADRVITRIYTWQTSDIEQDVTTTYYHYSTFHDSEIQNETTDGSFHSLDFGTAPLEKDCWHLTYTGNASTSGSNGVIGRYEANQMCTEKNSNQVIYDNGIDNGRTSKNAMFLRNGTLAGVKVWQTMKNVPAGRYKIVVDMNAYYRSGRTEKMNEENTGVYFKVIASNGDTLVNEQINAKNKGYHNTNNLARSQLSRYRFDSIIQPVIGSLKISIEIGPLDNSIGDNREVLLENFNLIRVTPIDKYIQTDYSDSRTPHPGSTGSSSSTYSSTVQIHRTPLRKRVLTMPDVCVPTYGAGSVGDPASNNRGRYGDDLSHTHRVFGPSKAKRSSWKNENFVKEDPNYVEYNEATWDGFTIRHGLIHEEGMGHGGGAGVNMYEGAHLRNCIVINNMSKSGRVKGGGIYCDGATATIEGCFVLNNISTKQNANTTQNQVFSGGMFLYEGTCFNSLFANNYSFGSAGGVGFCVGKFYNNTIAYNTCSLSESGHINGGAISVATESTPNLFVANTIVYGNSGMALRERTESAYQGVNLIHPFINCYIQTDVAFTQGTYRDNIINYSEGSGKFGKGNVLLTGTPSAATTPFVADFDELGNYVAGRAALRNDFRLRDGVGCVNKGTEDFAGDLLDVLERKHSKTEAQVKEMPIYQSVEGVVLPDNDVAFAKRVQDCQIDMGAYEFNAAYAIRPDTTTHPGTAIYYVTYDSPGGDASARTPDNAACAQKLQQVLDAAGRYKYSLMTEERYDTVTTIRSGWPSKDWDVEVWLQGNSEEGRSQTTDDYGAWYTPTRSTKHSVPGYEDNTLDYSFIVPHGIQVKGGYKPGYYHYEVNGDTVMTSYGEILKKANNQPKDTTGKYIVDDRDPLTWRTVFSGFVTSSTGASGQTFHVVTFTNDLFTPDEELYTEERGGIIEPVMGQLAIFTDEKDRAVLDGLFIEDGYANSSDPVDQIGAGAVVTDFAHIRNCVVQKNTALDKGGGLYLKPFALVSGTIIKKNSAATGGGMYIEAPASLNTDSLARIFTSTICENSATTSAGGMWFDNTYARVNSTALWHNSANDNANVSGSFSRSDVNTDYPFNFCAVESRRLEGQGNVELSPQETEGVRWDRQDPFNAILYYPIEMSSTLSRAGMTYREWKRMMGIYTTLDSIDIAGVCRMGWTSDGSERGFAWGTDTLVTKNNDFIEIGARAINKNFSINVDMKYVMNRLYVMHTDLINSKAARDLQDNTLNNDTANMYRQMGSCILNPFHRLGDAFDYIIAARKTDPATYRNRVFEVFIEKGTYYPYHNAYGEQDEVRNNTFLVPEGIYVIGGVDSRPEDHHYGQEGYFDMFTGASYGTTDSVTVRVKLPSFEDTSYVINSAPLDSIRLRDDRHRPMRDNNLNSVIEPWELERQTILSGNAVSGEDFTHVYHVITMHADSNHVGPQPLKFRKMNPDFDKKNLRPGIPMLIDPIPMDSAEHYYQELDQSVLGRTTEFDGIQITGGYANHLDPKDTVMHHYVTKTYFRGGGIFVDGNWTENFDDAESSERIPNVTDPAVYNIPIVVENCIFTNNMAGNGGGLYSNGGIYMFGCHFTQNYSQGPMTELDQQFIPWTAGGCIATNAVCDVSNTLFDNNEARRGMYPLNVKNPEEVIPYADARQGFAGVISAATQSYLRVVNCHFMKNKAVAYPSIYNFTPNNEYSDSDQKQFAFNTIFWGNEVFEVEKLDDIYSDDAPVPAESEKAFDERYKGSRKGVFHYDPEAWNRYEQLFHNYDSTYMYWAAKEDTFNTAVTDTLMKLRAQGDLVEGLYFCSYRKGYGPSQMKPSADGYLLTQAEQRAFVDPRQMPVRLEVVNGTPMEQYDNLFSHVHGNNNTLINRINNATDGPNFKQPTFVAGIDGYMQNADWVLARMNLTTDQGWGHLSQTVTRGIAYYITKFTGTEQFKTQADAEAAVLEHISTDRPDTCVYPVSGLPVATFDDSQDSPGAIYNWYSTRYGAYMSNVNAPLPIKDQYYMAYTSSMSDEDMTGNMERISRNPKMKEKDVYIDVGIYEYQYVQLDIKGRDIDTMWVATKAKDPIRHDGLSWETPTTDLQAAIDVLMSSHNNHDKYVCIMGDDEVAYSPSNVIDNRRSFFITSNTLEPLLPDSAEADHDYGVNSLTFLGGYSYDVKDAPRDPQSNPVVFEMPHTGAESQLNQLFVVEDMTRQMVQLNWTGEVTTRTNVVIPIVFDGITFINPYSVKERSETGYSAVGGLMSKKGGAAIYYRWQRGYQEDGKTPDFNTTLRADSVMVDDDYVKLPKLTISNCIFMDNGARTDSVSERSPAVRIDHGGGSSLIVNSLFHSNAGAPVYARTYDILVDENDLASVPNDVVMVNITSALNDGHIRLESDSSEVHNSLIWLDDLKNDTTIQLQMGTADREVYDIWDKTTNKNRVGIADRMTHNAVWGCFQNFVDSVAGDTVGHNHPLAKDNNDIFRGPGFMLPFVSAATSEERRERSFQLNPSIRTQNMADSSVYRNRVFYYQYQQNPDEDISGTNKLWRRPNGFKDTTVTSVAQDFELANKSRWANGGMERGAYECLVTLQRVLYVRPDILASSGDGSTWEKAFGMGQLQNAIDAAAVYAYMYQDLPRESRKAYVYVKGTGSTNFHYDIKGRDGVYVYGSFPVQFNDTAYVDETLHQFTDKECRRFKNYARASRQGLAATNAPHTKIRSIHITGDEFEVGFLLDGFVITNNGLDTAVSPILLNNRMAVVRNCIIMDNHVSAPDHPVANVQKGLLYNCLFYNNSADTVVRVGADGLALNNTIVVENEDATPLTTHAADGAARTRNNIACWIDTAKCFAPYMTDSVPYDLPDYLTSNPSLAYQLHEHSTLINAGTMDTDLPALFNPYKADSIIVFDWDRDVLGNPRTIGGRVDMGALETWRVAKNQAQEITALTNRTPYTATKEECDTAYTRNYGGHRYPHPGSVVYLMDSAAMTMQYGAVGDFEDFQGNDISLRPGFMLLKPGASLYGNGHHVQLGYVAAEKKFVNQRYSMTAMPFDYDTANITTTSYNDAAGTIACQSSGFRFKTYQYSGEARSAKDYVFQTDSSTLWLPVDTANRVATEGYLMEFETTLTDTVLRFNAFAEASSQYIYTEGEDKDRDGIADDKYVYLTKYDNRVAGTGAGLNFTRQEDMGWNMKGLPWLVSDYRTDTIVWEDNYLRQMHIPHVLYQMDGAGAYIYLSEGDNVYSSRSWDRGNKISMGSAFLTQTATMKDSETVVFHQPLYGLNIKAGRPLLRMAGRRPALKPAPQNGASAARAASADDILQSDILTIIPDSNASKQVSYTYGRDGLKWNSNDNTAQVYLLDSKRLSRISLLGAAPTDVDIPLGVRIPEEGAFTFSLPEKEAFADYDYVWLIDYDRNRYINLMANDYELQLPSGENTRRFAVRIGKFPKTDSSGKRTYVVFAYDGMLYVRGLIAGDKIRVYAPSGQIVRSAVATGTEFTMPLLYQSGYVVTVNDQPYKVVTF